MTFRKCLMRQHCNILLVPLNWGCCWIGSSKNLFTINPGTLSACITSEKSSSMAVDAAIETLSPPFHSPSHFSPQRNFYLAVDRLHFMMGTLMDLLGLAGRRSGLPMVVCCSPRDELDAVCSAVANVPFISLASLYTDLAEADRSLILEHFRQATMRWNPEVSAQPRPKISYDSCNRCNRCMPSAAYKLRVTDKEGNIYEAYDNFFGWRWDCNQHGRWG